jgi:hypothetical protein
LEVNQISDLQSAVAALSLGNYAWQQGQQHWHSKALKA